MKEDFTKVNFKFGNNDKYAYLIIDEKSNAKEIQIETDSIAYKIAGPGTYKVSKYAQLPFGNYDYILEIRNKVTSDFCGLTLVSEDEIEIL